MSLSSLQLDAFFEVVRAGGFSAAARKLHMTQSALSQRVNNLEQAVGVKLIVRQTKGIRLTETGEALVRYCQQRVGLEEDFLSALTSEGKESLAGMVRIGGFSTVVRSVVIPSLSPLMRRNPKLQVTTVVSEVRELFSLLRRGEVEFILDTGQGSRHGIQSRLLGYEEYVLMTGVKNLRDETYLDHDAEDTATLDFLSANAKKGIVANRSFLGDIYTIRDALKEGWGKAVMPRHLIRGEPQLRVVKGFKPIRVPVYLQYFEQPFYPRLHSEVVKCLVQGAARYLGANQ